MVVWEILLAVGIPLSGAAVWTIRYFWKKEQCFTILANKIDQLTDHDVGSIDTHEEFDERLTNIETQQTKNEIYLKLLLDDRKIPYNP